jgi:PIN domain nuclease of toxin-antitoxin system
LKSFLLDTHALLWMGGESAMLGPAARDELARGLRFVSVVSIAEIAIKAALGKLSLPPPFHTDFEAAIRTLLDESVTDVLPLDLRTVARLRHLPHFHKDPFDRMIIAQALDRGLTVATRDRAFSAYAGLDILEV